MSCINICTGTSGEQDKTKYKVQSYMLYVFGEANIGTIWAWEMSPTWVCPYWGLLNTDKSI